MTLQNLKQKIKKLWNKKFNEPLEQKDLEILLQKKGENYKYIKEKQNDTISFKTIPITKFSKFYTYKKPSAKKSSNKLISNDSIYYGIPKFLNQAQLIRMGRTSKYLDQNKSFPSKHFLTEAKKTYSVKKKSTQSLQQYKKRLALIQRYGIHNDQLGRPMNIYIIPNILSSIILLFPIRPLTIRQMKNIQTIPKEEIHQIQKYHKIQKYLFEKDFVDIMKDRELTDDEKIQLCHLNQIIHRYLILEDTVSSFFEPSRIKLIIKSLQSNIQLPEPYGIIPPLTEDRIINILNTIEYIVENIPNEELENFKYRYYWYFM